MESIENLAQVDFYQVLIGVFAIITGILAILTIIEKFANKFGIELRWKRKQKEEHDLLITTVNALNELREKEVEDIKQSVRHDKMIKDDIANLSKTVNGIVVTLSDMQEKSNETEKKKLKDSLVRYYNKYKNSDGWTKLEKDAFWDLFDDYDSRGGNGYVHSIIEPVMREMKEID